MTSTMVLAFHRAVAFLQQSKQPVSEHTGAVPPVGPDAMLCSLEVC
jgi:hypothetical protein